ncbi:MAG: hypothetical protein RMJ98_04605 [Myxococcales bacterium]|nr:hypothetical protein [Polyangiaceae bacterium]MDW8248573.1 hypothetical protein [Myxococcales bacterium]
MILLLVSLLIAFLSPLVACGEQEEGIEVAVLWEAPPGPPVERNERRFTSDLGYQIRLTHGYLSSQSVELVPCTGAVRRRSFSWVREAQAHGISSPTRLGFARVDSLLASPGSLVHLGTLAPPPGSYCALTLGLRVADEDAEGLPGEVDMVGKTIVVGGFYVAPGGVQEVAFEGETTASAAAKAALGPLVLSGEGSRRATLVLALETERWFDGADLANLSREQIGRVVLQNLSAAAKASAR